MAPMHLLMLERDPERREALLGVLRSAGHHAVAAPDAPAAAAAIGLPGFDALLLDLGIPDLDVARLREALAPAQSEARVPPARVKGGTLSFDGHGTPGDFVGTTSTLSGEMTGGDSLVAVRGWVEAPVKTLTTGNGRRDRDLNKSLESDKYS